MASNGSKIYSSRRKEKISGSSNTMFRDSKIEFKNLNFKYKHKKLKLKICFQG